MSAPGGVEATAERLRAAGAVLAEFGLGGQVEVLGDAQEMAVLCLPEPLPSALAPQRVPELVRALRTLGFRYITLDLDPLR